MSDIAEQVLRAADAIMSAAPENLVVSVRDALRSFLSSDFVVGSGSIHDAFGKSTPIYPIVIYRASNEPSPRADGQIAISADHAAVVIEICNELNVDRLRDAYARVSQAKQLGKTPVPVDEARTNITLGVVVAAKSAVSLDSLADELYQLNIATSHKHWLDMLVVVPIGVINYAIQFPGEVLAGDFMPPADGALDPPAPPAFYVTIVMRPTGCSSFNKLVAFVLGHLQIFAPDVAAKQLNWNLILEGQPLGALTTLGFQPNLSGELVAVPPDAYSGKFIPNKPVLLEDTKGTILAAVQFMKWQSGGIIIAAGKLPLEGLLVFLPNARREYLRVMKRPTHQISPVLPISHLQFSQWLANVQQRSNIRVRKDPGSIIMQKFLDEGTTVPFVARCTLGLLRLREGALADASKRGEFDRRFQSALSSIMTAREANKKLLEIWEDHRDRVSSGDAAHLEGVDIRILENVNKRLSDEFEAFLNASARATKTGIQGLAAFLGFDIGYLFKRKSAFDAGIDRLRKIDGALADYLLQTRNWTERLILLRNNLEHDIWEFPRVNYSVESGRVRAIEPKISGEDLTVLVTFLFDRTICFFEEVIAYALQHNLPCGTTITEIALAERIKEVPERFRITLAQGGEPPWRITYHQSKFDDT
ncbi:DUF6602 domain-containing protein [Bradyrhizobium sp. ARR65]|uniref:DUF6602 domain-containing protein n=1 Tax=Bradyrhizobium sp. ARR65 TaxID=1040989 RepID=UPI000463585C|nr:DUF6602 domain-containing protein [Bradyrhizobium sp. ARR65]